MLIHTVIRDRDEKSDPRPGRVVLGHRLFGIKGDAVYEEYAYISLWSLVIRVFSSVALSGLTYWLLRYQPDIRVVLTIAAGLLPCYLILSERLHLGRQWEKDRVMSGIGLGFCVRDIYFGYVDLKSIHAIESDTDCRCGEDWRSYFDYLLYEGEWRGLERHRVDLIADALCDYNLVLQPIASGERPPVASLSHHWTMYSRSYRPYPGPSLGSQVIAVIDNPRIFHVLAETPLGRVGAARQEVREDLTQWTIAVQPAFAGMRLVIDEGQELWTPPRSTDKVWLYTLTLSVPDEGSPDHTDSVSEACTRTMVEALTAIGYYGRLEGAETSPSQSIWPRWMSEAMNSFNTANADRSIAAESYAESH